MLSLQKFKIQNNNILTNEEQKNLNLLYQPLIGVGALGLYNTLYFLNQKNNPKSYYNHQFLLDLLNIDEIIFTKYKEKLEATNLLSTFKHPQKETLYLLKIPLHYNDFFQDPILNEFLLSEIGENTYLQLQNLFFLQKDIKLENYKNISKNFSDVYHFKKINIPKNIINHPNLQKNDKFCFFQKYFNYESFIKKLPQRFKKPFLLEWKNIEYILKLSFIYEIKPKEMALLYQNIFSNKDPDNLELNNLKNYLKRQFLKKNTQLSCVNVENINNEEKEMIFYLKNSHPNRIINNFIQNSYICYDLYDIAFQMIQKNNVDIGIINALFMYICSQKKDNIPTHYNYFKTVLNSWIQKGISSTENAYDFLMENNKFKNNNSNNTINNNKNRPEWLDEVEKELGFK